MNTSSLPWHLLQSFAAISAAGSLSAAATAAGSSQPTLSRHLMQLEAELGVRLFYRSSAGLTLTPEGAAVQAHVDAMAQAAALVNFDGARVADLAGTVRLTASQITATYLLPAMLAGLSHIHPALNVEVVATDQTDNLLRREADIALRMYRPTQNDLIVKKVAELPMGIYAARSYIARHGDLTDPHALTGHRIIGYDRDTRIIDGMQQMGLAADRSSFAVRSDDQVVCWHMMKAGMGVGFGLRMIGDTDPDLVAVLPDMDIGSLPVWLAAHPELRMSPRVRVTFDHLAACFEGL